MKKYYHKRLKRKTTDKTKWQQNLRSMSYVPPMSEANIDIHRQIHRDIEQEIYGNRHRRRMHNTTQEKAALDPGQVDHISLTRDLDRNI